MDERKAIEKWLVEKAAAYYEGNRIVSDAEFNAAVAKLKAIAPDHPYLTTPGWGYSPKDGIQHKIQIATDIVRCTDYADFISRFDDSGSYTLMPKYDGITVVVNCRPNCIEKILSRGNGIIGKPIGIRLAWAKQLHEICRLLEPFGGEGAVVCSASLPSETEFGKARDAAAETLFSSGQRSDEMRFFPHSLLIGKDRAEQVHYIDSDSRIINHLPTEGEIKEILREFQSQGYDCDGIVRRQGANRYVHYC